MSHGTSRPLSPHIQVYRWQWTMLASIMHRATGVALTGGTLLLAWWLIAAAAGPGPYAIVQGFIGSFIGMLLLFAWSWALFFHLCSGIRHLVWDAGVGFDLPTAEKGAYIVAGASIGLTLLTWIVGLIVW
ncbi:succinate dehydrogenase, cytochrome b556 subunit [Azospirillum fermentarium]|uniref:succinate dehydrogenase, cytochrome b556 subunit n=1 Tax=Azospirillum fermentarium TaxID=1233114 RepID=UPI002227BCF6|nr:succinate dehydrogenase, cytochrome b556 subunit [Azospirillum fermentarium]